MSASSSDLCERCVPGEIGDGGGGAGEGMEQEATVLRPRNSDTVSSVVSNTHHWSTVALGRGEEVGIGHSLQSQTIPNFVFCDKVKARG